MTPPLRNSLHALALSALGFTLSGCSKAPADTAPVTQKTAAAITVKTAAAQEGPMPRYLRLTGEITAAQNAAVAADTTGKVIETPVERGTVVKAGDVLVQLDSRTAALNLVEAEANVVLAKSKLDLAESEVKRNEPLVQMKAVAATDFARIKSDRDGAAASLSASEARRDMTKKTLEDSTIRAPFDGTVAERFVTAGEYVMANSKVAQVIDLQHLRLLVNVSEPSVGLIHVGQTVEFTVSPFPGEVFTATVKFIGAAVRAELRDLQVEAEVTNTDGRLRPGLFAEARLTLPSQTAITLPASAVRTDGANQKVWVVESGQLTERLVEVGETDKDRIEIRRGVKKGENAVLAPGPDAADGVPVQTAPQS
ncbi:efflux RND transporter periplasmic adaptor subunit [Prosthecobacter sp.]|uniref:efflux RND transporter periplasmic adaptor subunit n=1 Tax=Prosthecobacter sp. TaxID=1965333 RepID=UPI002487C9DC|nr:efflux RND transporter periplasmic adaptor subunit [Prosthecobacter sp.]MDI1311255.1 efflux RND transporter periplasmic adaptor subunit [Prosthecobacter sp.]